MSQHRRRVFIPLAVGAGGLSLMGLCFLLFAADNQAATMVEDCKGKRPAERASCYQQGLERVLTERGTEQALTALEQLAQQDAEVLRDGHVYAHHLGRASFSHYGEAATAFSHCRDTFWSGCYHGVLEGYLSSRTQVAAQDIATLCRDSIDASQSTFIKYQCVHGLGHGLTMYFDHDIFKALSFCDALPTDWDRESCYGGVFMENIIAFQNPSQHGHHGQQGTHKNFLNPQDPFYPCNAVEGKYQRACYMMQTSAILTFFDQNFDKAFQVCDKAPTAFIPTCYQSLGRDISGATLRDGEHTMRLCRLGAPQYRQYCVVGAVKDFILTSADPQRGFAFCRALDAAYKHDCYAAVGEILISLYPDHAVRGQACTNAEEEYQAVCNASARVS